MVPVIVGIGGFINPSQACEPLLKGLNDYAHDVSVSSMPTDPHYEYEIVLEIGSSTSRIADGLGFEVKFALSASLPVNAIVDGDFSNSWFPADSATTAVSLSPSRDSITVFLELDNCLTKDGFGEVVRIKLGQTQGTITTPDDLVSHTGGIVMIDNIDGGIPNSIPVANPGYLNIKVFPNPVKDRLCVDQQGNEIRNIRLLTLSGALVLFSSEVSNKPCFSVAHLPEGLYVLDVLTRKGVRKRLKVIIQK